MICTRSVILRLLDLFILPGILGRNSLVQPKQKRYTIVSMEQDTKRLSSMHADRPCNSCLFDIWQTADQEFGIWKTLSSSNSSLLPGISKDMKGAFTKWVTKCGEPAPQNAETLCFPWWQTGALAVLPHTKHSASTRLCVHPGTPCRISRPQNCAVSRTLIPDPKSIDLFLWM